MQVTQYNFRSARLLLVLNPTECRLSEIVWWKLKESKFGHFENSYNIKSLCTYLRKLEYEFMYVLHIWLEIRVVLEIRKTDNNINRDILNVELSLKYLYGQ